MATLTYNLNKLQDLLDQPLVLGRSTGSEDIDPELVLGPLRLHPPGPRRACRGRPGPARRDRRGARRVVLRGVLGLRLPRGRGAERRRPCARALGVAGEVRRPWPGQRPRGGRPGHDDRIADQRRADAPAAARRPAQRPLRRPRDHRRHGEAAHAFSQPVAMPLLVSSTRSTSVGADPAVVRHGEPPRSRSVGRDFLGDPAAPAGRGRALAGGRAHRAPPGRTGRPPRQPAHLGLAVQSDQPATSVTTARGEQVVAWWPR